MFGYIDPKHQKPGYEMSAEQPSAKNSGKMALINARLLDPSSKLDEMGSLLVEGRKISDFGPRLFNDGLPEGAEVLDCEGKCLCPGFVDMRAHLREPGAEHKETLATASAAASAGGISSVVCMPNTDPVIDQIALIEFIARRARETSIVKVFPAAAITKNLDGTELTEIGMLSEAGAVGFSDADRAVSNSLVMKRALSYAKTFDALIIQHPEDPALSQGVMNDGELATRLGLQGIPTAAETIIVERDIRLVELTEARYHVGHLSTGDAASVVKSAKSRSLPVTASVAAHHFSLNENAVADYRTFAKVSPPLRSETDRALMTDYLSDGTIDVIVSDHAPHDQDSKRVPFSQAADGIVGLETMFPLSMELYHNGKLPLLDLLAKITLNPAALSGLDAGELRKGRPADLTLFDPEAPWTIKVSELKSKSQNSPYDERPVQGRVLKTWVNGRLAFHLDAEH